MNRGRPAVGAVLAGSVSRRRILKGAVAMATGAFAAPMVIPSRVLGKDGAVAPSNQITFGIIGYGNRCRALLPNFLSFNQIRFLGVSDCLGSRQQAGKQAIDQHYGSADCKTHNDFRELLARTDVQAVLIATGNRWHGLASIMAARAGKDIYSEKPICLSLEEGRTLVETCKRTGAIYQAGHQRRSVDSFRFMIDVIHKGLIGRLHTIQYQVWENPVLKAEPPAEAPPDLNWDMWLGPTPWHPYSKNRHFRWQYFWDTADGMLTDMGCHWADISQWGHKSDDTGPIEFEGNAEFDHSGVSEAPVRGEVRAVYADGVKLIMTQKGAFKDRYIRFTGDQGWIQLDDDTNVITAEPKSILKLRGGGPAGGWDNAGGHIGNLLQCIETRQPTVCNPETAFRSQSICLVDTICLRLGGRKLRWDPKAERFIGDDEANRMMSKAMRAPWHL